MAGSMIAQSVGLFVLAGLCEIGGGWLVWQWLRESRSLTWGLVGGLILILYGIIPTFSQRTLAVSTPRTAAFLSFSLFCGVGSWMGVSRTEPIQLAQLCAWRESPS